METLKNYIGKEVTGEKFNQLTKGLQLVKLTNKEEIHNGYKFEDGDNKDTVEFNPIGRCLPGGIYFIDKQEILKWINYGYMNERNMIWYRKVSIPNSARVYIEHDKYKSDIIILGPRKKISEELLVKLMINNNYNISTYRRVLHYVAYLYDDLNEYYQTLFQIIMDKERKVLYKEGDEGFVIDTLKQCILNCYANGYQIIKMIIQEDLFGADDWKDLLHRVTSCFIAMSVFLIFRYRNNFTNTRYMY